MLKDIKLLSEIYSQNIINEDPDDYTIPSKMTLGWKDPKAVPYFVWGNQFIFGKVFGTAHNSVFARAIVNNYMNLPLDYTKADISKAGLTADQIQFNEENDFIVDVGTKGGFRMPLAELQSTIFSEETRHKKLQIYTLIEYYTDLIMNVADYLNVLKLRGAYAPCGRAWIGPTEDPNNVYISNWPSTAGKITQAQKNAIKKNVADLIRKFPSAFKIRDGYNFFFEDGEETFDAGKEHIEVDPTKRKEAMVAKGIKAGTSKEAELAQKAGYDTVAHLKRDKIVGDSYNPRTALRRP